MRTRPWDVDDAFWRRVEPLIPPVAPGKGPGRPRVDDRRVFGAIVYVLRTGAQWNAIPRRLCSSSTAHRRFQEWERAGVFRRLWEAGLLEYDAVRGIDWEWQAADGSMITAPFKGPFGDAAVGPNPTVRGKPGVKRSLLTNAAGVPLAGGAADANAHDMTLLDATLDAAVIARPTPSRRRPHHLCLDKGCDYPVSDAGMIAGDYICDTARRGEDPRPRPSGPGNRARRWVVERTVSWLNRSRRCLVRWEKKKENYLAFLHLAFARLLISTRG